MIFFRSYRSKRSYDIVNQKNKVAIRSATIIFLQIRIMINVYASFQRKFPNILLYSSFSILQFLSNLLNTTIFDISIRRKQNIGIHESSEKKFKIKIFHPFINLHLLEKNWAKFLPNNGKQEYFTLQYNDGSRKEGVQTRGSLKSNKNALKRNIILKWGVKMNLKKLILLHS